VAFLLPHSDRRCREFRIGEATDGASDVSGKAFALPIDSGAACWTEMKGQRVAAFSCPRPRSSLTRKGDRSRRKRAWLLITAPVRR
jgi:hypothetical protein